MPQPEASAQSPRARGGGSASSNPILVETSFLAVAKAEIIVALHFHKAADRPVKFKSAITAGIKCGRRRIGNRDKFDLMFIKRVDERDKTRSLIAVFGAKPRNADQKDGVITPRNRKIIGAATRFSAQFLEREYGNAFEAFGNMKDASPLIGISSAGTLAASSGE